jgi:phosphohistidine phosphatase
MKKELLLLRHAKSSWDDPRLGDFDRPLAPRGRSDAPRMGSALEARGWHPLMALVSPAKRTRETWQLLAAELKHPPNPTFRDVLYEASADLLLNEVQRAPEIVTTLLMLGHNPGIEDFALRLAGDGSNEAALKQLRKKFPTAGLARLEFTGRWDELRFGGAHLLDCLRPKELTERQ